MSDTRAIGVSSLKPKTDFINSRLKDLDAQVELACQTYSSLGVSVSDVYKRLVNTEKEIKTVNKNQKTYSEIVKKSGIRVTFLRYFDKRSFKTAFAELSIDARDENIVHDSSFGRKECLLVIGSHGLYLLTTKEIKCSLNYGTEPGLLELS
ncbi:unnamed protein product [Mytilus coruscus]|uniref:Uncharacterized protein n=1 Tax=Mytilus coruscus TaxID=42192 RepID=A0A6J8CC14_MYTCO|nr:unnamed protein product [Mytilus coruscus]